MLEQGWHSGRTGMAQCWSRDGSVVEQEWLSAGAGMAQW